MIRCHQKLGEDCNEESDDETSVVGKNSTIKSDLPSSSARIGSHANLHILILWERLWKSVKVGLQFNI